MFIVTFSEGNLQKRWAFVAYRLSFFFCWYMSSASFRVRTKELSHQAELNHKRDAPLVRSESSCSPKLPKTAVSAERKSDMEDLPNR
jgi:hypothetical protein